MNLQNLSVAIQTYPFHYKRAVLPSVCCPSEATILHALLVHLNRIFYPTLLSASSVYVSELYGERNGTAHACANSGYQVFHPGRRLYKLYITQYKIYWIPMQSVVTFVHYNQYAIIWWCYWIGKYLLCYINRTVVIYQLLHTESSPFLLHSPSSSLIPLSLLPTDPTFTLHNVTIAVKSVHSARVFGYYFDIPVGRSSTREKILRTFITTVPNASWETLAGGLYQVQEHAALQRVTEYFQPQPGIGWVGSEEYVVTVRETWAINSCTFTRCWTYVVALDTSWKRVSSDWTVIHTINVYMYMYGGSFL